MARAVAARRVKAIAAVAFSALLALTGPAFAAPGASPGEGFDVEHYRVELQPDLKSGEVTGKQTVVLRATQEGLAEIAFSPNALQIDPSAIASEGWTFVADEKAYRFLPPEPLAKGQAAVLFFTFSGTPARGTTLLDTGLYTGYFGCDWMVCLQDSPGDKATFALDLLVPPGTATLGPGNRIAVHPDRSGLERHSWGHPWPVSPYLFAFAAGDFVARGDGAAIRILASGPDIAIPPGHAEATADMATFFAGKAGFGLPTGTYTQLLVPGSAAQESAGFSAIGTRWLERERDDPGSAWVVAHELAHEWWGNSITCESWRHFWLNEGFATFMVAAWKEHSMGADAYAREIGIFERRRAQLVEAGWDKPLAWDGDYPSLGVRRGVQYSKGALFLHTLRETMGDEAFWDGVRSYSQAHRGGTVTSEDFQRTMEAASGRDLGALFDQWVYAGG